MYKSFQFATRLLVDDQQSLGCPKFTLRAIPFKSVGGGGAEDFFNPPLSAFRIQMDPPVHAF